MTDKTGSGAIVFQVAPTLINPVVTTQSPGDNSTKAASTAYVDAAAGAISHLVPANNLSDVANAGTARTNLGLGTAATKDVGTSANDVLQLDGSGQVPASVLNNAPSTGRLVAGTPLVLNPYAGSVTTVQAHGLGISPAHINLLWTCLTADMGYSAGDTVDGIPLLFGFSIKRDATNLTFTTSAQTFRFVNPTTFNATTNAVFANWKLTLTPYKLT